MHKPVPHNYYIALTLKNKFSFQFLWKSNSWCKYYDHAVINCLNQKYIGILLLIFTIEHQFQLFSRCWEHNLGLIVQNSCWITPTPCLGKCWGYSAYILHSHIWDSSISIPVNDYTQTIFLWHGKKIRAFLETCDL